MKIEVTDLRNDRDDSFVASQLGTYNATFTIRDFRLLRAFVRDADGSIIGGLLANTYWQYLRTNSAPLYAPQPWRCTPQSGRAGWHSA